MRFAWTLKLQAVSICTILDVLCKICCKCSVRLDRKICKRRALSRCRKCLITGNAADTTPSEAMHRSPSQIQASVWLRMSGFFRWIAGGPAAGGRRKQLQHRQQHHG